MKIIPYRKAYAAQVSALYHGAVQAIDEQYYCAAQKLAWSSAPRSAYHWHKRLTRTQAWLMIDESSMQQGEFLCVGFINVETHYASRGYIDSLYVLPRYQGQGVATRLCQWLEDWACQQEVETLSVDASKLSKPLFLNRGFRLHHNSYQEKSGQIFKAYFLSKSLSAHRETKAP